MRTVLLLEKDSSARAELAGALRAEIDCVVLETTSGNEALETLEHEEVCVLIAGRLDPPEEQLALLQRAHHHHPDVITVAAVPLGDQESLVKMLRMGCFTYLNHPYHPGEAVIATARSLYHFDLLNFREKRGAKIRKSDGFHGIIGRSPTMEALFDIIRKVAEDKESTVLIHGESGTGKELVAKAVHANSPRKSRNFVPLNCAAIPDELLESELFGYVKGAFTGALTSKKGRIQFAEGGTLFLDEIGDMKPSLQAKLLRVLQERTFEPVGGLEPVAVDVRILAATHHDLEKMVESGSFREDLFYRLNVIPVNIPALRDRREDIPLLIDKFVQVYNRNRRQRLRGFTPEAISTLMEYPWPGNVRELENLVQRLVILHGGRTVGVKELPERYAPNAGDPKGERTRTTFTIDPEWTSDGIDFNGLVNEFENRLIRQALTITAGNKKEAARLLHLNRTTLIEKIKKKGLDFS